ncbi:MAG TPA: DUF5615 family PIN-like protein [Thioalkalivibrio sp.]|nr:DUF5615 family PIN-like protein [Thioalkalivibrio sp.]
MRFLVDAQLPPALARWLSAQGCPADHVADLGMEAALAAHQRTAAISSMRTPNCRPSASASR